MRTVEAFGKTVEEATKKGLEQLGITEEEAQIKVLDEGSRGIFGLFSKFARVEVTAPSLPDEDTQEPETVEETEIVPEQTEVPRRNHGERSRSDRSRNEKRHSEEEEAPAVKLDPIDPETLDEQSRRAFTFLTDTARLMGVNEPGIAFAEDDHGMRVRVEGDHIGTMIGHRGETLDALQLLTGLVVNHHQGESDAGYCRVTLDVGGYRSKREETLRALALRLASKARRSGRSVTLEPMNSYERRIIHSSLHDFEGVTTYSEGDEPYRYVVIAPVK